VRRVRGALNEKNALLMLVMMPKQFSAVAAGRDKFRECAALVGEAIDGRKALI
jgi:hypothetical protein